MKGLRLTLAGRPEESKATLRDVRERLHRVHRAVRPAGAGRGDARAGQADRRAGDGSGLGQLKHDEWVVENAIVSAVMGLRPQLVQPLPRAANAS